MKWVVDTTGRFKYRPQYDTSELDSEFEKLLSDFLIGRHGSVRFPVSTDDLTVMIEKDASDLDLYADLSVFGEDVEGVTEFYRTRTPAVRIAKELSIDDERRHRLRTTLAHEYGHVKLHQFLWDDRFQKTPKSIWPGLTRDRARYERLRTRLGSLPTGPGSSPIGRSMARSGDKAGSQPKGPVCGITTIIDAPSTDWMEWQAGYAAGALLMPAAAIRSVVAKFLRDHDCRTPVSSVSALTDAVSDFFDVSSGAARVRLDKLGILN